MFPVHFMFNGIAYTKVNIPDWMRRSKLIEDHVSRGDVFAVDDRTKTLSVFNAQQVRELNVVNSPSLAESIKALVHPDTPEVNVQFYRNKLREISASAKAALGE